MIGKDIVDAGEDRAWWRTGADTENEEYMD